MAPEDRVIARRDCTCMNCNSLVILYGYMYICIHDCLYLALLQVKLSGSPSVHCCSTNARMVIALMVGRSAMMWMIVTMPPTKTAAVSISLFNCSLSQHPHSIFEQSLCYFP